MKLKTLKNLRLIDLYNNAYQYNLIEADIAEEHGGGIVLVPKIVVGDNNINVVYKRNSKVDFTYGIIYEIVNYLRTLQSSNNKYTELYNYLNDKVYESNLEYYLNWSGQKYISPLCRKLFDLYDNDIYSVDIKIAKVIVNKNVDNWLNIYNAYFVEYNPIYNYNMEEEENVRTDISTERNQALNTYGFNTQSQDGVPTDKNSQSDHVTGDFDKNRRKLTRKGNIGVTTTQKMVTEELKLRNYNFINMIYKDIDKTLCLSIY